MYFTISMIINTFSYPPRLQFIKDSDSIFYEGIKKVAESKKRNVSFPQASVNEIATYFTHKIGIKYEDTPQIKNFVAEIANFVKTGDFEVKSEQTVVCFNPTLLTLEDKLWQVTKQKLK